MSLSPKQQRFVEEYLVDLNAAAAARRAGYAVSGAAAIACRLMADPVIQEAIAAAMAERSERTTITADRVITELWGIATADPNELVEHRVSCCRFCWGNGFQYQRTPNEARLARTDYEHALLKAQKKGGDAPILPFDEAGGEGFDATREPNPNCPECFGEGVGRPVFRDSRQVSRAARSLYAGVKITRDGMEMRLQDKGKALELLGRHLGMFTDRLKVEGELAVRQMSDDEINAKLAALLAATQGGEGEP